jgi:DNA-binding Xre family transcriptional regulator
MVNSENIKETLSRELKTRMTEQSIRLSTLANYCDVSPDRIAEYKSGQVLPSPWVLVLMAERLGCSANELLGYKRYVTTRMNTAQDSFPGENHYAEFVSYNLIQAVNNSKIYPDELSRSTGIGINTVNKWFTRWPCLPRTGHLVMVAEALGCTPSELLGY